MEQEATAPPERKRKEAEAQTAFEIYREIIKENIDYDILIQDMKFNGDRLNEIVDLMLETVCTRRKTIRIAGENYPAELVKADCMKENTTKIRNIKQYLRTVLFNARPQSAIITRPLWLTTWQAAHLRQRSRTTPIHSNRAKACNHPQPQKEDFIMGRPAVKLQNKSLQLNTNKAFLHYDMASTEVMWKDGAKFSPAGVSVSAADVKAQNINNSGIVFAFDRAENTIIAKLNNTTVAKGSYKFKVNVKVTDTLTISTPLTVKVVDTAADKSVKVSSKGSIDVLNRTNTFVTVTPALKALNGKITAVQLTGNAAHLFEAECADNKVIIHAKENASLITKYSYKVILLLTLQNAEGDTLQYTTPDISLKLKQGKPKVTIAPNHEKTHAGKTPGVCLCVTVQICSAAF